MEEEAQERIEKLTRESEFEDQIKRDNENAREMEEAHAAELKKERAESERILAQRKERFLQAQKEQQGLRLAELGKMDDGERKHPRQV